MPRFLPELKLEDIVDNKDATKLIVFGERIGRGYVELWV